MVNFEDKISLHPKLVDITTKNKKLAEELESVMIVTQKMQYNVRKA